jgi:hypothetical protein
MFRKTDFEENCKARQALANGRASRTYAAFTPILKKLYAVVKERCPDREQFNCPPILYPEDCPAISVITPTYSKRHRLFDIAFHNMLLTDYPKDKIEWIIVEDSEEDTNYITEKIVSFQIEVPNIKIKYIPIKGNMSIGNKRNIGIEHSSNDIILLMDDDDHYPQTSFRRRVAWLTKGIKKDVVGGANIVCCTTLALYDLKTGVSAVNVPPYDIPFSQRISEATLTFRKSAWIERPFADVSISEGEGWIVGRESQVIEIPSQQIIVAFSHGENKSSRYIPTTNHTPSCFWGFPREYLHFIHGLVGVTLEDDAASVPLLNASE